MGHCWDYHCCLFSLSITWHGAELVPGDPAALALVIGLHQVLNTTSASCYGHRGHMSLSTATIETHVSPTLNLKCSHAVWLLLHLSLHSSQVATLLILSNVFMSVTLCAMHAEQNHIEDFLLIIEQSLDNWSRAFED